MFANALTVLGGLLSALGPHYAVFGAGRVLAGFGTIAAYALAFVYGKIKIPVIIY